MALISSIKNKLLWSFLSLALLTLSIEIVNFIVQRELSSYTQRVIEEEFLATTALVAMKASMYHTLFHVSYYLKSWDPRDRKEIETNLLETEKYYLMHRVYHLSRDKKILKVLDDKIDEFTKLIGQILLLNPTTSNEKIEQIDAELHFCLASLSKKIRVLEKNHLQKIFNIKRELNRKIHIAHIIIGTFSILISSLIIVIGIFMSYYISNPLIKLAKFAEKVGKGNFMERINIDSQDEIGYLAQAFNQMLDNLENILVSRDMFAAEVERRILVERELRNSLKEKEILLKEVHHRVKNNLQVISSIINLQIKILKDRPCTKILKDAQHRIKAMSLVHENLYKAQDLAHISFKKYVDDLTRNLFRSYNIKGKHIQRILKIEDISLDIETAICCGLIINELISNSLKYAFKDRIQGRVGVFLQTKEDDWLELKVCDDGVGLPPDLDWEKTFSLGLKLVRLLIHQLEGKMSLSLEKGTCFKILFKRRRG